ncbi:MAG: hypothetical protein RJB13_1428 [Pseudomonadota bacterium]
MNKYLMSYIAAAIICAAAQKSWAQPFSKCLTQRELDRELLTSVNQIDFKNVIDLGPNFTNENCPKDQPSCKHGRTSVGLEKFPQLELAVIAFQPDCSETVVGSNAFYSRDYPEGIAAQFDQKTLAVKNVRMYKWEQERFDGGKIIAEAPWFKQQSGAWKAPFPSNNLINKSAAKNAHQFMSPYPASVFKILVAIRVLQKLEEQGPLPIMLGQSFTYDFGTAAEEDDVTLSFQQFLDAMIQWSGNTATAAMIQYLHKIGDIVESTVKDDAGYPLRDPLVNRLNDTFRAIGLPALQMNRTRGVDGLWGNRADAYNAESSSLSHIHMPAWDTARLLWYMRTMADTPLSEHPTWHTDAQSTEHVNPFFISNEVKKYFWANLGNQLFHEVLSNTIHCEQNLGGPLGIPALMPLKWTNSSGLRLPLGNFPFHFPPDELEGNYDFTKKLSNCQRIAEVRFASKTGLTSVSGSHAGLVKGLSERGFRREYIVVLNSSLGSRFTDDERLDSERVIPCFDKTLCYSQRINQLGANIDNALSKWLEEHDHSRTRRSTPSGR